MNRFFWLSLFAIFFIPLFGSFPINGTDVWYVQYIGLLIVFFLGIALLLWDYNEYISLLLLACLFSALYTAQQHPRAILCLFQINLACIAACVITMLTQIQRKKLLYAVFGLFLIQSLWVILQFFNLDPIFDNLKNLSLDDTVGFSGSKNQIGVFFAVTSPLVLYVFPPAIVLSFIGLYGSLTTTSAIAMFISCIFYLLLTNRKLLPILILIFTLGIGIFYYKFENINMGGKVQERVMLVNKTIQSVNSGSIIIDKNGKEMEIESSPLNGFGLGNFIRISPYQQNYYMKSAHRYAHAHNDFVEFIFETGYIGGIIMILLILDMFWRFFRARKNRELVLCFSCILAQLICSLGVFTVHTAVSGMLLVLFYGLFEGALIDGENS